MDHTTTNTDEVLKERGKTYGKYSDGVKCRAEILSSLNDIHLKKHGEELPFELIVLFSDMALKMMRIASDPKHKDSWIDLNGYAKLAKEMQVDGK